ncbi:hypothetical protein A2U01_0048037, partial [Trifolium medium]|nr:hypothetical protein [Trifolium medium]
HCGSVGTRNEKVWEDVERPYQQSIAAAQRSAKLTVAVDKRERRELRCFHSNIVMELDGLQSYGI